MAHRYFIKLSYDGSSFHGWQIQKNAKSIQETLNQSLSTILRTDIYTVGCGRTDTGVHARVFYAHFDINSMIDDPNDLQFRANCMLPKSIAIHYVQAVGSDLHSRFSATSRAYEYLITTVKDPFKVDTAYELHRSFDLKAISQACQLLVNTSDFTSFSKLHSDTETNICDVTYAQWSEVEGGYRFEIRANRFLRNMVRAIVGSLIEVGENKMSLDQFQKVIDAKDRSAAGFSVPAHGLYLIDITYPKDAGLNG